MPKTLLLLLALIVGVWLFAPSVAMAKNEALDRAREAASHSEWEQAAELAQQAVAAEGNNPDAWAFLGEAHMTLGDTAHAIESFEKAVSLEPKQPAAVLTLTRFYLRNNRVPDAERVVANAEARDKKGKIDEIKVARGMIFGAQNNMSEATKILMSATAKNPKNPLFPQILARIYEDKKVYDLAEQYYADAWALSPGDPVLAYEYGLVLQEQKKYEEALNLFKQVQEKDPNNKSVDYMIGRLYFAARRYAEAATQFEKAVEKRPDHFLSHFLLGRAYLEFSQAEKKNFYPQAVASLRRAYELRADRQDVRAALAQAIAGQGWVYYQLAATDSTGNQKARLDSSLMFSYEALALDSTAPGVYGQVARAWFKARNFDSSAVYSQRQLALTPDDETEFQRLVSALQQGKKQATLVEVLGPRYQKFDWSAPRTEGDSNSAQKDRFLERFGGAYSNALLETGNAAQSRETLRTMLSYRSDWCDGHNLLAYTYLAAEQWSAAVPVLQQAVKACPSNGDLWASLGNAYYFANPKDKDNVEAAKNAYRRACNLGNGPACENLTKLNQ